MHNNNDNDNNNNVLTSNVFITFKNIKYTVI